MCSRTDGFQCFINDVHSPLIPKKVLLNHLPTNGMIKFFVLFKHLNRKLSVTPLQLSEQRADELYAATITKQIRRRLVHTLTVGLQSDNKIPERKLNIGAACVTVRFTHFLHIFRPERFVKVHEALEEDIRLLCKPVADISTLWLEGLRHHVLPSIGKIVALLGHRLIILWFGWVSGSVEPLAPIQLFQFL